MGVTCHATLGNCTTVKDKDGKIIIDIEKTINHHFRFNHLVVMHLRSSAVPSKNAVSANIKHIVDTSIKRQISGQSNTVVKCCMYICLQW